MSGKRIAGLDGCRDGWVVAEADADLSHIACRRVDRFGDLFSSGAAPDLVAVDIPIGLPDSGARDCDVAARRLLGPRRYSVFAAPIRPVLTASTYEKACEIGRRVHGKAMSLQAWGILGKVCEVDRLLRRRRELQAVVREVHPEVAFRFMNAGTPMAASKKKREGREARLALIRGWAGGAIDDALARRSELGAKGDDILDAFAVLWSARRLLAGEAEVLPRGATPTDRYGLRMEITA